MTEQVTEIAVVKAQLEAIQKAIDEVKIAVTDLSRVGTSVAIMQQQQDIHAEKIERTTKRVDALSGKLDNNSGAFYNLTDFIKQKQSAWRFVPSISPTQGRYASSFGPRIHPVTGEVGKMHYGVDIANDRWTPIYASADGVVDVAQMSSTFGNFVTINHGNGIVTRYGHMQMSLVNPGQFVRRYQIIGYMGNTGRSVGPHLHYEVWVNNNPVNPLAYMLPGDYAVD